MGMADGRKGFQMHDEVPLIDTVVVEDSDFLPGVEVSMDVHLVVGFRNTWPFDEWFYGDDLPVPIVDMPPWLELLYEKVELFAMELLVQCLRLAAEEVELPQSILGQREVVVGEGFVNDLENLLGYADLIEDEEKARASFEDPIKIGVVGQAISKCKHPMNLVHQVLRSQLPLDVCRIDGGADPLIGPPSCHSRPQETILAAGRVMVKADEASGMF